MDSDTDYKYIARICSGLRKRQPARIAYDAVRRLTLALKVKTDRYRLKRVARDGFRRPTKRIKRRVNPKLENKKFDSLDLGSAVVKLWNRWQGRKKKQAPVYSFPRDYSGPEKSGLYSAVLEVKEYLGNFFSEDEDSGSKKPEKKKKERQYFSAAKNDISKIVEKEINESYKQAG